MDDVSFSCSSTVGTFLESLEKVYGAVAKKDIVPVLQDVLLETKPSGRLYFMGSNGSCSVVTSTTEVTILREGRVVLPAKRFLDVLRSARFKDKVVFIIVTERAAKITIDQTVWTLALHDAQSYPQVPMFYEDQLDKVTVLKTDKLISAIESVKYAAKNTSVPSLMIIDMYREKVTACDGVRFQQTKLLGCSDHFQIPILIVEELLKFLLSPGEDAVELSNTDDSIVFRKQADVLITKKWTVKFPDVETLLLRPALENRYSLKVDKKPLVDAVRKAKINADTETNAIELNLTKNLISVRSWDSTGNFAVSAVSANWDQGERNIVVHQKYLLDMLFAHQGEECKFKLGDKSRKSAILLEDHEHGTLAVTHQMLDLTAHPKF